MIFCYITIYIKWQGVASLIFYGVLHFPSISARFPALSFPCSTVPLLPDRHPSRQPAHIHRKRHVFSSNLDFHAHTAVSQKTPNMGR